MRGLKVVLIVLLLFFVVWIDLRPISFDLRRFGLPIKKEFKTHLGLDLKGGSHLVFETDTSNMKQEDVVEAVLSVRDIIEKRVNFFGITEPVVQTLKSGNIYRINVDLPGIEDVFEAIQLIGKTAQLFFKEEAPVDEKVASSSPLIARLTQDTGLTGKHIQKARVLFDPQTGKPQVALSFSEEGKEIFAKVTERNVGKAVAIVLDSFLLSAPVVEQAITDGNAVITGSFRIDEAKNLAIAINSGTLPVPVKLVEQRNIGPTLGAIEVKKSIFAGVVGLAMVLLFMVSYYGRLGVVASIALILYGLISFAMFRVIPIVLTLPGIAGFILSIGMAVDSNILIFERIKEELRKKQPLNIAVRLGFGRAIDAIKDANFTTLLVTFILFNPLNWEFLPQFGMVRGFALTLAIGVATSLFTGVVITRRLIQMFYKIKM